jgi:hypothetical protein
MVTKLSSLIAETIGPQHYFALLFCVLSLTVIAPLVDHYMWARAAVGGMVLVSVMTASLAVSRGRSQIKLFLFAFLSAVMWTLAFTCDVTPFNTSAFGIATYGVTFLFFATTCSIMWRDIFAGVVTMNRICGAVCIYLIIGFCFAMVHMMVLLSDPTSYKDNSVANQSLAAEDTLSAEKRYPLFVYFSFCTLSTLGYGDMVPVSRLARSISWVEGLTGQLYLTILVARLVGLHIANAAPPRRFDSLEPESRKAVRELEKTRS